jgi:hypothetical protein
MIKENQIVKHIAYVKAVWDKAPNGPNTAAALKHYQCSKRPMKPKAIKKPTTSLRKQRTDVLSVYL